MVRFVTPLKNAVFANHQLQHEQLYKARLEENDWMNLARVTDARNLLSRNFPRKREGQLGFSIDCNICILQKFWVHTFSTQKEYQNINKKLFWLTCFKFTLCFQVSLPRSPE